MADSTYQRDSSMLGAFWLTAALFTIGYAHLNIFQALLSFFAWPYYIGLHLAP